MASMAISINEELRPAMAKLGNSVEGFCEERVLVHMGRVGNNGTFVCEHEGGYVLEYRPEFVRFLDSKSKFGEICWEDGYDR